MQEFTIATLVSRALAGWRTPVAFAAVFAVITLLTLAGSRPAYRVTMQIVPAPSDQGSQGIMPTSGLTSLLGLGTGGNINFMRYQKLLSSPVVAQRLQDKYGMLQFVFAGSWDKKHKRWIRHRSARDYMLGWLLRLANVPTWNPPDITALAKYLEAQLVIVPAATNDIVTVTMDSADVPFAKRVMLLAHEQANQVLRDQIARRSRLQVAYMESKLAQTSVEDYRATLLAMLASQQKMLMLAQTDASFAAEILSPPTASSTPVSPRPVLGMFIAVLVGILTGLCVVIFAGPYWWRGPWTWIRNLGDAVRARKTFTVRRQ